MASLGTREGHIAEELTKWLEGMIHAQLYRSTSGCNSKLLIQCKII